MGPAAFFFWADGLFIGKRERNDMAWRSLARNLFGAVYGPGKKAYHTEKCRPMSRMRSSINPTIGKIEDEGIALLQEVWVAGWRGSPAIRSLDVAFLCCWLLAGVHECPPEVGEFVWSFGIAVVGHDACADDDFERHDCRVLREPFASLRLRIVAKRSPAQARGCGMLRSMCRGD